MKWHWYVIKLALVCHKAAVGRHKVALVCQSCCCTCIPSFLKSEHGHKFHAACPHLPQATVSCSSKIKLALSIASPDKNPGELIFTLTVNILYSCAAFSARHGHTLISSDCASHGEQLRVILDWSLFDCRVSSGGWQETGRAMRACVCLLWCLSVHLLRTGASVRMFKGYFVSSFCADVQTLTKLENFPKFNHYLRIIMRK